MIQVLRSNHGGSGSSYQRSDSFQARWSSELNEDSRQGLLARPREGDQRLTPPHNLLPIEHSKVDASVATTRETQEK